MFICLLTSVTRMKPWITTIFITNRKTYRMVHVWLMYCYRQFVSESTCIRWRLANSFCVHLLRHTYVYSTQTEPTYTTSMLSEFERINWHDQQFEQTTTLDHDGLWLCATNGFWTVPSTQFHSQGVWCGVFKSFPKVTHAGSKRW